MRKYFGTDGIRGKAGIYPMSPDFVLRLGYAAGRVLANEGARVLIGKDTRISSYMFESALEAGLTYAGVGVALIGPMPTPGIAYLTQTLGMVAGCVVSASHNPYYDNGIKFFNREGHKLDDALELEIEKILDQEMVSTCSEKIGRVRRVTDAAGRYIEFCKSSARLDLRKMKIVLDCANGATYHIAPNVFKELGAEVITIGTEPSGFNINDNVGSTAPEALIKKVLDEKADCGIAFDGDGDRLIIVDNQGNLIDGDDILYLLAIHRKEKAIVGTIMSNLGFEASLQAKGIDLIRANVGDRYVLEALNKHNLLLGGENSGHIICKDKHTTGDGIIAALQALKAVLHQGSTFHELLKDVQKTAQVMVNVNVDNRCRCDSPEMQDQIVDIEHKLNKKGRVLVRPSGTEPVVRVMVEAENEAIAAQYANHLAGILKK